MPKLAVSESEFSSAKELGGVIMIFFSSSTISQATSLVILGNNVANSSPPIGTINPIRAACSSAIGLNCLWWGRIVMKV